jgi:hypothetical protein
MEAILLGSATDHASRGDTGIVTATTSSEGNAFRTEERISDNGKYWGAGITS